MLSEIHSFRQLSAVDIGCAKQIWLRALFLDQETIYMPFLVGFGVCDPC